MSRRVPAVAALLDVGIGTAGALLANADFVKQQRRRVTGTDITGTDIERARDKLLHSRLQDRVPACFDHR